MEQKETLQILQKAIRYELSLAAKYDELQGFLTEPSLHQQLKSLEQTARNHLHLLDRMIKRLQEGGFS